MLKISLSLDKSLYHIGMKFPKGIHKTKKPKMSSHRGRTWDYCKVILPDGVCIDGFFDTSWGMKFYFQYDFIWYSGKLDDWHNNGIDQVTCDLTALPNVK